MRQTQLIAAADKRALDLGRLVQREPGLRVCEYMAKMPLTKSKWRRAVQGAVKQKFIVHKGNTANRCFFPGKAMEALPPEKSTPAKVAAEKKNSTTKNGAAPVSQPSKAAAIAVVNAVEKAAVSTTPAKTTPTSSWKGRLKEKHRESMQVLAEELAANPTHEVVDAISLLQSAFRAILS